MQYDRLQYDRIQQTANKKHLILYNAKTQKWELPPDNS